MITGAAIIMALTLVGACTPKSTSAKAEPTRMACSPRQRCSSTLGTTQR
jgi:hypothetical protein